MIDLRIERVIGRRVWDSRGRPTVEAEVRLVSGASGCAIAPAGASRGSREAVDLRDGGEKLGGYDVQRALAHVNGEIARRLRGMRTSDHAAIDAALNQLDGTPNKSRLGGNATIAVSMACAWAAANAQGVPLWSYLRSGNTRAGSEVLMPLPEIQIFGGGAHAGRRVDIQDFMLVPSALTAFAQALEWTAEVYCAAGELMAQRGLLRAWPTKAAIGRHSPPMKKPSTMLMRAIEASG